MVIKRCLNLARPKKQVQFSGELKKIRGQNGFFFLAHPLEML